MRTHITGVAGSNPARVTNKSPLVKKATESYLTKATSLENFRALSLVSAALDAAVSSRGGIMAHAA